MPVIPTKCIYSPPNLELIAVELLDSLYVVVVVYLPPNIDDQYSISFLKHFSDRKLILLGDFNLPDINWNLMVGSSRISNLFCDFVFA